MNWRALFGCKETAIRLDDLELGEGDKLVLIYSGVLSETEQKFAKLLMEDGLRDGRHKVIVLEGGPRIQVVRKA